MKKLTLIFLFSTLIACGQQHTSATKAPSAKITTASLEKTLNFLASDKLKGREIGTKGIEKAAKYIEKTFKKAGLKPYYKTYRDTFHYKGKTGYNLIAYKEGSDPKLKKQLVMLSAHYDHIGVLEPVEGDSIANGANDDGSGTVAVLELAKHFAQKKTKRSMLFVLFSGEEEGLIGSTHLAKRLQGENASMYVMLEYEMIGVPLKNKGYTAYLTGYNKSNFAKEFNTYAGKKVLGFLPQAQSYNLFKRSDNYPFYKFLDIPAQALSTFDFTNFDQYHKVGDETDRVDFEAMKNLIVESIPGIEGVVNSDENEIKMNE